MQDKNSDKRIQNMGELKTRFQELTEQLNEMRASL
ncbi:hypothetical protein Nther_2217 [Natranaerobius thermophilus JW/NM-WN-LF]|uniref:Uncharacterized protein n=1 Tax=Natranaerobius thermophilus (strain ATCC BAA-1301 / DSM 18059 / JW/NM-WN-LF) TaxID=457570 RepID=B2A811_NATTJ|nr:hypothetical protein Nther_2217 [Natranaerobius thermophilus JW/NM-WN-LF]